MALRGPRVCHQTISSSRTPKPPRPGRVGPSGPQGGVGKWRTYLDLTTFETVAALAPTSLTAVTVTR